MKEVGDMAQVKEGTWVEIEKTLLTAKQRAPQVPQDTKETPYLMKVSGFLTQDASIGDNVTIKTVIGREITGCLKVVRPHYEHSFGETVEELLTIGTGAEQ